jgi:hypothetical protein
MSLSIRINVNNPDELREELPSSGIFELFDCRVHIDAPGLANEEDVAKMISIIKSVINVTEFTVTYIIDMTEFCVKIEDVPLQVAEGRIK